MKKIDSQFAAVAAEWRKRQSISKMNPINTLISPSKKTIPYRYSVISP